MNKKRAGEANSIQSYFRFSLLAGNQREHSLSSPTSCQVDVLLILRAVVGTFFPKISHHPWCLRKRTGECFIALQRLMGKRSLKFPFYSYCDFWQSGSALLSLTDSAMEKPFLRFSHTRVLSPACSHMYAHTPVSSSLPALLISLP